MKKTLLTLGAITTVLGGSFILTETANAYRGDPSIKGPECTEERHQEMEQAFDSNDYQAWKNLMQGKGRVVQVVNEENFPKFAEAHRLAEEGNLDAAKQIRAELGLGLQNGTGGGYGQGQRMGGGR